MHLEKTLLGHCCLLAVILFNCQTNASPPPRGQPKNSPSTASETDPPNSATRKKSDKPNIIFIFADDLGYNDVGFIGKLHGSAVQTPNIDRLAAKGVILDNYYVQHLCTPTRSQLLTGRYQIHTGLQHGNIPPLRPYCLPLDEVTLPQKLKEVGYSTYMIGKWHLGHQREECLPTNRGFDGFLGLYLGSGDHYQHTKYWTNAHAVDVGGYDFHKDYSTNRSVDYKYAGSYSTHIFASSAKYVIRQHSIKRKKPLFMYLSFQAPHAPLQVPAKYRKPFASTLSGDRLTIAAMIYCMDEAIGKIVEELKVTGLYNNTVLIFSTDNGGAREIPASNWPYRGSKGTYWEGGLHGVGFVTGRLLPKSIRGTRSQAFIHVSDWFPTIVSSLAGGNLEGTKPLDGVDVWESIISGKPSPRTELVHNINPRNVRFTDNNDVSSMDSPFDTAIQASMRMGDWKLLTGDQRDSIWTAPPESGLESFQLIEPDNKLIWLFNITADPYELKDLSQSHPEVVHQMLTKLQGYADTMVTPLWPRMDNEYDPAVDGDGAWGPWTPTPLPVNRVKSEKKEANAKKKKDKTDKFQDAKTNRTEKKLNKAEKKAAKLKKAKKLAKKKQVKLEAQLQKENGKLERTEKKLKAKSERLRNKMDKSNRAKEKSSKTKNQPLKKINTLNKNIGAPQTIKKVKKLSPRMIRLHHSLHSRPVL